MRRTSRPILDCWRDGALFLRLAQERQTLSPLAIVVCCAGGRRSLVTLAFGFAIMVTCAEGLCVLPSPDEFSLLLQQTQRRVAHLHIQAAEPDPEERAAAFRSVSAEVMLLLEELRLADSTLRKQRVALEVSRAEVERERARYVELFEAAPEAYFVTDLSGTIREANRAAGALLDIPPRGLIDTSLVRYVADLDRSEFLDQLNHLNVDPRRQAWAFSLTSGEGHLTAVTAKVSLVRGHNGTPLELRWMLQLEG